MGFLPQIVFYHPPGCRKYASVSRRFGSTWPFNIRAYLSPTEILSKFLARPAFARTTQDIHGFVVHILNALPDRNPEFGSSRQSDKFGRGRRRGPEDSGGRRCDGWDRGVNGRRRGIVRSMAETSAPIVDVTTPLSSAYISRLIQSPSAGRTNDRSPS